MNPIGIRDNMMILLNSIFHMFMIILSVNGIAIDNGVVDQPTIECGQEAITIKFRTQAVFGQGKIYAKGFSAVPGCYETGVYSNSATPEKRFMFNSPCGFTRFRPQAVGRKGLEVSVTVVISFHHTFLTKVDRAYRITCFYMEAEKTVTAQLDVSMLTTQAIENPIDMPICRYEILDGGIDGPPIRYARIGQPVYHKWTCEPSSNAPNIFCMLVHDCIVDDGISENPVPVLDPRGCQVDRYILQQLDYITDLTAGQEAHVFKFADRAAMRFQCQIQLSIKEGGSCSRPQCSNGINGGPGPGPGPIYPTGRRYQRTIHDNYLYNVTKQDGVLADFDLPPKRLVVLDIEDSQDDSDETKKLTHSGGLSQTQDGLAYYPSSSLISGLASRSSSSPVNTEHSTRDVCLSSLGFALFVTLLVLFTCFTIIAISLLLVRYFHSKKNQKMVDPPAS